MKEHIAKLEAENAAVLQNEKTTTNNQKKEIFLFLVTFILLQLREELRLLREELTLGLLNLVAKLTPPTRSSPRQQSNP